MGFNNFCHNFQVFVGFLPILVGGNRCEQFNATPFLGAFEINAKAFSPGVVTCVLPFEKLTERGVDCLQKNILERLYDHSLLILYDLPIDFTSNMLEVVCKVRCEHSIVNPPNHFFFHLLLDARKG